MASFIEIALPHSDIFEGRFTMDAYASDLWEVFKGSAPEEYRDREIFFSRTYETSGINHIIQSAEKRLKGEISDPIIQLQTPFGGGKTHTLIYLYHKAKEWNANVFVFCGDKIGASESTIWAEMERQLSGKVELFKDQTPPSGDQIKNFLSQYEPLLILMDEVHAYLTVAQGVKVEKINLASLTLAFIQFLTNSVKSMSRAAMFMSLPASSPYADTESEKLLSDLKNIVGRNERICAPVSDDEVANVIRRRLFSRVEEDKALKVIDEFVNFAERENILPKGVEKNYYRERFLKSYPFQPEVIDVLYTRWGSFPNFQRTRGALRLLALVVKSLIGSKRPYIRLADFNLKNDDIRRELIKHIGQEYDSIIAQDITSETSGARKVDRSVGESYKAYNIGTATATAIFMYSFSGAKQRGATKSEIILSASDPNFSTSIITDVILRLKENLFYLSDEGLYFTNRPNLNKLLVDKMENINQHEIEDKEKELLEKELKDSFKASIWPQNSKEVSDSPDLKLVVLKQEDIMQEIYENYGERPRNFKNNILFLTPDPSDRVRFEIEVRKYLAWKKIEGDTTYPITDQQKKEIKEKIKQSEGNLSSSLKNLYRRIYVPSKGGLKEIYLGKSTYGRDVSIDREVYEKLKNEGELVDALAPKVLFDKYLSQRDYVETKNILDALLKVPGEIRISSKDVLVKTITKGVSEGIFGLGKLENGAPCVTHFKTNSEVNFHEDEIIIKGDLCEMRKKENIESQIEEKPEKTIYSESYPLDVPISSSTQARKEYVSSLRLVLPVPAGKISNLTGILRLINDKFKNIDIKLTIEAYNGILSKSDYEGKIKEAFNQLGIVPEKEDYNLE